MAKQLNVDLNVRANASEAKKSLQDLQKTLTQLTNMSMSSTTTGMTQAAQAAKELSVHLNKAINTDTGKLNLNALNSSLKASKTDLSELSSRLLSAGSSGQAAFTQLAQSIAAADRPLVTMGTHLSGFLTTLKNTARWQISSSILHGFMGTIQSAYGYAQDLNQSLNNIRIVTGQSVDQMAQFAEQANKAAKALSTTTTAYTDAALIYYQQGLTGKEVTDRTDVTIKMANVSRQSAEEVSSQMTAIWNNFADGSKELEYYADVITALGAATASSSDEIAEGLQKFASIADTVGLSYEKATAALATVVAETRQSADVVGTAFKTMFARLQGLSLGETLEDGVDLNKYSSALKTVGVDIIDANGNLKDMDSILDETAEKWNTISEAQKVALAETVAGVRQYSQFMAIMENYDKILANQDLAAGSSGTLQEQADIYAQSWEAAQKRVKASLQSIYSDLIDDKFFIKLTDGFAKLLSGLDAFIDGIGGLKTLLIGISGFVLSSISGKIGPAINQLKVNLTTMFQSPMQQAEEYSRKMQGILSAGQSELGLNFSGTNKSNQVAIENANQLSIAKNKLLQIDSQLTPMEKQLYQQELDLIQVQQQSVQELANKVTEEQRNIEKLRETMDTTASVAELEKARASDLRELEAAYKEAGEAQLEEKTQETATAFQEAATSLNQYKEETKNLISDQQILTEKLQQAYIDYLKLEAGEQAATDATVSLREALPYIGKELKELDVNKPKELSDGLWKLEENISQLGLEVPELTAAFQECTKAAGDPAKLSVAYQKLLTTFDNVIIKGKGLAKQLNNMDNGKSTSMIEQNFHKMEIAISECDEAQKKLNQAYANFNPSHILSTTEAFSQLASVGMQAAMVITSIKSAINAITAEDMSPLERITTLLMSIGMIVPSTIGILNSLTKVTQGLTTALAAQAIVEQTSISLEKIYTTEKIRARTVDSLINATTRETTAAYITKNAVQAKLITQEQVETVVKNLKNIAIEKGKNLTWQDIAATIASTTAEGANTSSIIVNTAAKYANWVATELLNKSSLGLMATFIAFLVPLALVVAAIWGLVKAFQAIQANTPEGKLKAAQEKAEEFKNTLDEATTAANDLKSAFDSYESVRDKLKSCTKGTEEWYEALNKVNDQVLDLLAKYPELSEYLRTDVNGAMYFDAEGMAKVQQAYNNEALTARGASIGADAAVREAQINVDRNNLIKALSQNASGPGFNGGGGETISAMSKLIAENAESLKGLSGDQLVSKIGQILTSGGFSKEFAQSFADTIENNGLRDSIIDLSNSIKENSAITQSQNQAMAASILANNDSLKNSEYAQSASRMAGNIYGQTYEESYAQYSADGKTAEEAEYLATVDAINAVNEAAGRLVGTLDELANSGNAADHAFKDFLTSGTLENTFQSNFQELYNQLGFDNYSKQTGQSRDEYQKTQVQGYLNETLGGSDGIFDDIDAQEYGATTAEEFVAAFQQEINDAEIMWDSLSPEEAAAKAKEIFDSYIKEQSEELANKYDLDAKKTENYAKRIAESFKEAGMSQEAAAKLAVQTAIANERLDRGLTNLNKNIDSYRKKLVDSNKGSAEWSETMDELKENLADVLNVDVSTLTDSFGEAVLNSEDLQKALDGDVEAIKRLQAAAAEEMILTIRTNLEGRDLATFTTEWEYLKANMAQAIESPGVDQTNLINSFNAMIAAGHMTKEQIETALAGLHVSANLKTTYVPQEVTVPKTIVEEKVYSTGSQRFKAGGTDEDPKYTTVETFKRETVTYDNGVVTRTGMVPQYEIEGTEGPGGITTAFAAAPAVTPSAGATSGGSGGGSCFVAGTLISMQGYYKKIERIKSGDIVLSYNEQTMKNEYSKVLQTMIHKTIEKIYSLFIEDEKLQVTGIHRFLITRNNKKEWIQASELKVGDLVLFADGTLHRISKIKTRLRILTVYNFEVSNNHNYYVGKNQILAHNKGGGGGGGKAATTKAATHKHEVHRYNNEENTVKGLSTIYDRLETAKSKAFGADRIRIMERELAMLKKLKDASADYLGAVVGSGNVDKVVRAVYSGKDVGSMIATGEFGGTIADDYRALFSGKSASGKNLEYNYKDEAGNERLLETEYTLAGLNKALGSNISVGLDSYGNINNKDKLLYDLDELYNQEMNRWSKIAEPTAAQENEHNRNLAYIEEFKERLEQFDETAQLIQEKVDAYLDYIYQAQALNAEKIVHELEVNNTLTEHQLEEIQNAIKLLGNKIYRSTEAMNEWFRKNFKERQDAYAQNVSKAQSSVEEAMSKWQLWAADELNPEGIDSASALDIIDQAKDQVQAAFDDIFDQIDEMRSFFGDTLDYWNERIQSITDAMEANVDTLDHLQNVLSLLGKATDYKALGVIIKGALDVAKDNYLAAKAKSEASSSLYNQAMRDYASLSGENAEFFYESTVMPAREQMLEDQANMQAALENVLEKVNAWFENELNRIYQESEDRLVDKWGSFDALDSAMERQKNLADEYLTKTNQLYETNTLLRKLSQDIDKTDSQIAKAKLKAFSDEIEAMKEQNQLSKTDLEIAKARYELLQAQIALEEAQNAKSVVRLQRDNEGNYGYVYTADQDKVNDAEQNFADKQNDLYNLVLNQAQDYTEKIIQTTEERNAALRELNDQWLNGEITDWDEYLTLRNDITQKYDDLLRAEYESYYTAVRWLNEVGAEGQTEAWTNSFSDILYAQDDFATEIQAETDRIVTETDEQMNWLNDQRAYYTNEAKVGNKELKDSVDDITNANKLLTNSLTGPGGLISGMSSAATAAERLTREFASQYEALLDVAAGYAQVISEMNAYYATIAAYERSDDSGNDSGINLDTNYDSALQEAVKRGLISGTDDELFKTGNANREKKINALGLTQDYYGEKGSTFVSDFSSNLGNYKSGKLDYDIYGNLSDEELLRKLAGFATGGYTGRWGESGKLALLHEKELVLNDKDTSNILNAVTLIRQISSAIDLRAAASSLSSGLKSPFYNNENGMLEQIVTIHAEFPNVQSHNEIEEAFDDLINRASQFANRR